MHVKSKDRPWKTCIKCQKNRTKSSYCKACLKEIRVTGFVANSLMPVTEFPRYVI